MHQLDYIIQKIDFAIITFVAIITFNFFLFLIVPGDPTSMMVSPRMRPETRERIRAQFGLDKPIWLNVEAAQEAGKTSYLFDSQSFLYLKSLSQGDLGDSFRQRKPVSELIGARLPPTLLLIFTGEIIGIIVGTVLGMISALKARSKIDVSLLGMGLTIFALPPFWLGIMLLVFSRGTFPAGGFVTLGADFGSEWQRWLDISRHLVLPAATLALLLSGAYLLVVRNSMLEILAEDYILTAKAQGFRQFTILKSYALKNAALPLVTIISLDLGMAMGGWSRSKSFFHGRA